MAGCSSSATAARSCGSSSAAGLRPFPPPPPPPRAPHSAVRCTNASASSSSGSGWSGESSSTTPGVAMGYSFAQPLAPPPQHAPALAARPPSPRAHAATVSSAIRRRHAWCGKRATSASSVGAPHSLTNDCLLARSSVSRRSVSRQRCPVSTSSQPSSMESSAPMAPGFLERRAGQGIRGMVLRGRGLLQGGGHGLGPGHEDDDDGGGAGLL
eukprot:365329-Chlamydomonas_euryale.AAC.11